MTRTANEQEDTMSVETVSFTAHDRCDRCGSQALSVARKAGRSDLLFCGHHNREHEPELLTQGWEVIFDAATYESYRQPVAV